MQIFNGKIKISNVSAIEDTNPQQWSVDAIFQSTEEFQNNEIKANDIVILKGYNEDNVSYQVCKYKVVSNVDNKTSVTLVLQYDDVSMDVYAPSTETGCEIGLIGRLTSESGFTILPSNDDGIDIALLQKARNIDLSNRDVTFTTYVKQLVKDSIPSDIGGTDDTKLPIAGGTITGDLKVNGSTDVSQFTATSGKNSVSLTANGLTTAIEADLVTDKKTVLSSGDISSSVSRVSTSGVSNFTDRVNGTIAKRVEETSASNGVTNEVDVKSSNGTSTYVVNTTGNETNLQLNSQSTSGTSNLDLTASSENSTSEINLTAQKINLNGTTTVNGSLNSSGDISTNNGTITAQKYLTSSEATATPDDNQLITSAYLKDYVAKNGSSNVDTSQFVTESGLTSTLADYVQLSTLQYKVDTSIDLKLSEITSDDIQEGKTKKFVSADKPAYWDKKQDAIDTSVFEQTIKKGVANGYAPLNNDKVVPRQFLDLPDMSAIETPVSILTSDDFAKMYNAKEDVSTFLPVEYETKTQNSDGTYVQKTVTPSQVGLSGQIRMGKIPGTLVIISETQPKTNFSKINDNISSTQDNFGEEIQEWRIVYVDKANEDDCFSDARYFTEQKAQWPGQQMVYELGVYDSTNRKIVSWSNLVTDTMPQVVKDLINKTDGSSFVNDNLKDVLSGTTTINGIEFDKKGRATGNFTEGSSGGSSSSSSLKWLKDDSKGLQVYSDAKDLSGFTRTIKGADNVSYVVPSGVNVKSMIIKIDNSVFLADGTQSQKLVFDANGVICGSDATRFPAFACYIDENGVDTVQHEYGLAQNGTLSTTSIQWDGNMDEKLSSIVSGAATVYVRLDF